MRRIAPVSVRQGREHFNQRGANMTTIKCPNCGKPLAQREGKKGKYWSCTGYPDCRTYFDNDDCHGGPQTRKCVECGQYLRSGRNSIGYYTACFNKEGHADGQVRFFDPEGKPRVSDRPEPNGTFFCPECKANLLYLLQKRGEDAGKPIFLCANKEGHADGKTRFFKDNAGAPVFP
jgi:ssDNA-binding Zn-finger/Zn-ribbon topoisomerase 1